MAELAEIEVFENDIELFLDEFCNQCKPPIEDLSREPQAKWNAALMYVNKYVFKGTDKLKLHRPYQNCNPIDNLSKSNCNAYDTDKVDDLCNIYIYLCGMYDKEISIMGFSKLSGIKWDTLNDWGKEKPSSPRREIYQKLRQEREESLCDKLITGGKNQVGIIAILNRHFGYASPYTADSNRQRVALTADQLPQLGTESQPKLSDNIVTGST